jgi:hypothetical protein
MTLAERLIELHKALNRRRIPHAFGGAIALAYCTSDPRGTDDIDVNVFIGVDECERALRALPSGVAQPDGTADRIRRDGQIRLWWDATPVDLFFNYDAIHEEAAQHRRTVDFGPARIPILGPVELAVFKAVFDRSQDWVDIENMVAAQALDVDAVRAILTRMFGPTDPRFAKLDEAIAKGVRAAGTP